MTRGAMRWMVLAIVGLGVAAAVRAYGQAGGRAGGLQIGTFEGSIAGLDLASATPSLRVSAEDGKARTLRVDELETSVWKGGRLVQPQDLEVGQRVRVRHMSRDGKDTAQSIEILQAGAAPGAAPSPGAGPSPEADVESPTGSPGEGAILEEPGAMSAPGNTTAMPAPSEAAEPSASPVAPGGSMSGPSTGPSSAQPSSVR